MKIIKRIKGKSLFFKLFILSVALILLPTIIVGIYCYNNSADVIENEIMISNQKSLELVEKNIYLMLTNIENELLKLSFKSETMDFMSTKLSYTSKLYTCYKLMTMQEDIKTVNNAIDSFNFYSINNLHFLNDKYYYMNKEFADSLYFHQLSKKDKKSGIDIRIVEQNKGEKAITLWRKVPYGRVEATGIVAINIKVNHILDILEENIYMDHMNLYILNGDGSVLMNTEEGNKSLFSDLKADLTDRIAQNLNTMHYKDNIVTTVPLEFESLICAASVPESYIQNKLIFLKRTIVVICLVLIFIGIIVAYILSKYLYHPVNQLVDYVKAKMGGIKNIKDFSENSEFSYINFVMKEFVDSKLYVENILRDNKYVIKNNFFRNIIDGYEYKKREFDQNMEYIGVEFKHSGYQALIVSIDKNYLQSNINTSNYFDRFAVINIAEEILLKNDTIAVGVDLSDNNVCIIINTPKTGKTLDEEIVKVADMIRKLVEMHMDFNITIGIGNRVVQLYEINESLKMARHALNYSMIVGKNKVISFKDVVLEDDTIYLYPLMELEKIINNMKAGCKEKVLELLDNMFDHKLSFEKISVQGVKYLLIQLLSLTSKGLIEKGINIKDILGTEFKLYEELDKKQTIQDIRLWLKELFKDITVYIKNINESAKNDDIIVGKTIDYIKNHYIEPISLTEIADVLNITPQYLSKKFKEITGENFVHYLNKVRLEKAEALLTEQKLTINEAAAKAGFNNYKYFIKKFKEMYGLTPAKYRDRI